jgi:hypothetical protein
MADSEFVGSALVATWVAVNSGGTALGTVTLSTDFRNFTYTPSLDLVDATAGADSCKKSIASFKGGQITCSQILQSDIGTATMAYLAEGQRGTMTWAEAGTATGKPKHVAGFLCLGSTFTTPYNDIVTIDTTWSQDTARTDSVY